MGVKSSPIRKSPKGENERMQTTAIAIVVTILSGSFEE
jgi:hypothetical protein